MTLKLSPKNPRVVLDELDNEVFVFTGLHYGDLPRIVEAVNDYAGATERAYNKGFDDGYDEAEENLGV